MIRVVLFDVDGVLVNGESATICTIWPEKVKKYLYKDIYLCYTRYRKGGAEPPFSYELTVLSCQCDFSRVLKKAQKSDRFSKRHASSSDDCSVHPGQP